MDLDASFIVPTYRRADVLDVSVPLFLGQTYPAERYEIVVVSDGPDADTSQVMARLAHPRLTFDALPENRGPGAARNRAVDLARGRILVFVDDDSLVRPDFLQQHLAAHNGRDDVVATGPLFDVTDAPAPGAMTVPLLSGLHTNPFPTLNASVARQLLLDAGGFDEAFREYGWEDNELYERMAKLGTRRRFVRRAPIWHLKPPGENKTLDYHIRRERMRGRNGRMYFDRHPNFWVGLSTKQLGLFRGLDRALDTAFGLERKLRAAEAGTWEPTSGLMRSLVLLHAEISSGRRPSGET